MMGGIQRHGMGLRASGDRPRGDHRALFAVNDHHVARVPHNYKHSWRRRIECEACGIQALDLDASRKFAVLYVDDFDRAFGTFFFEPIEIVDIKNGKLAGRSEEHTSE